MRTSQNLRTFYFLIFLALGSQGIDAQTLVKGKITDIDSSEPLIGALVVLEDTKVSTITDANGNYSLIVPYSPRVAYKLLEVKYVGYSSKSDFVPIHSGDSLVTHQKNFQLATNSVILEDVVITANRVEEELQDVPVAASVINSSNLTKRTVSTTLEALEAVPNLVMDSYLPHQPTISLRGLATNFTNSGVENEIGLYIDDVYYSRSFSFNSTIMDIERVEVLRGPQGTLFGKNTIGGVVHVISEKPEMYHSAAVELMAGNYAALQTRAKVNAVLSPNKLALRLVGAYKKSNGWLREENPALLNANRLVFGGGRASLLYTPTDKLSILVRGNYSKDNSASFSIDYQTPSSGNLLNLGDVHDKDGTNRVVHQDTEDISFYREAGGTNAKITYQLNDKHTLTSISAYNTSDAVHYRDFDATPVDAATFERAVGFKTFSQELRLSTPRKNKKYFYVCGLFYLNERINSQDSIAAHPGFLPVFAALAQNPAITDIPNYEEAMVATSINSAQSYAAFASGSLEVSERVRINGGLRLTFEDRKLQYWQQIHSFTPTSPGLIQAFAVNAGTKESPIEYRIEGKDARAFSGNIGMDIKTTDKILLYINVARGFKGAGFNVSINKFPTDDTFVFEPEFLNSYEFGIKTKFNKRFRWNTAAFVTDYKNKQEAVAVGPGVFIYNAESAQGIGLESEFTGVWAKGFRTEVALGAMRLRYYSFPIYDFQGNLTNNLSGNELFKAPSLSFKFSPEYSTEMGRDMKVLIRADYNFVGKTYNDIFNTEALARQATGLINARLAFSIQDDKYSLALWGKNLTNETYIQHAWDFVHAGHVSVNQPLTMGVELRVNFY